jgi:transcriptional regulator GlxA family with amidase domain
MMHDQSDEPMSIRNIAQSMGVGLRSLQLAFAEVYGGLGPRDYLNRIRLDKARQRLLAAHGDCQVTKIALDSGFFHLGRFAQTYARTFGERPSQTLARSRGPMTY